MGLKVIAATGNSDNLLTDDYYGADFCVDHTSRRFVSVVLKKTGHLGVDFVLDYGASDLERNIECLNTGGKIAIVDLGGEKCVSINFIILGLMQSEIKVINLPSKDFQYKASVIAGLKADLWPAVLQKKVVPATDYPFLASEVGQALDRLKNNDSTRKIIVRMDFEKSSMDFEKSSGHLKMQ
ncbi:uncharacterized protein [Primulina huaijiensis]|uniref:uncharacterized protein isoform X2 n=1 Tax=Primulina huaijiensis TaxID=1492673 RepID=UPI003CC77AFC